MRPRVDRLLDQSTAVALLGPRQVGKTTLAHAIADTRPSIYLDLESDADRAKLTGSSSETLLLAAPDGMRANFYPTAAGAN